MQRKQSSSLPAGQDRHINCHETSKTPNFEEGEKGFCLFGQSNEGYKPDYLQLPIKIETRSLNNRKFRKSSESYSEEIGLQNQALKDYTQKSLINHSSSQIDALSSGQHNYDIIDDLLFPLGRQECQSVQHFEVDSGLLDIKEHLSSHLQQAEEKELEPQSPMDEEDDGAIFSEEKIRQRKNLLNAINNFQAYNQSLNIVMNFHKLLKRDNVNRMYGSILDVLGKESRKMEAVLCEELKQVSLELRGKASNIMREVELQKSDNHKDLFRTMPSDERVIVKEEYFEDD